MAVKPLPDQETLLKLLRYEPETGKLYWRARTSDMFISRDQICERLRSNWNSRFAGKLAFTAVDHGYCVGYLLGRKLRAHRVIWCMIYGDWPDQIDHINQNRADNRLHNLRVVSREENARNASVGQRNRSGRIGVFWNKRYRRWRAKIRANGRYIELGNFINYDDACRARREAEEKYGYSPLHGSPRQR